MSGAILGEVNVVPLGFRIVQTLSHGSLLLSTRKSKTEGLCFLAFYDKRSYEVICIPERSTSLFLEKAYLDFILRIRSQFASTLKPKVNVYI